MTFHAKRPVKVQQSGNTLVAAYQTAHPPLVWKFDLDRNHSFSLALQAQGNEWELGIKSPKEDFHPIARFLSHDDAEEAFAKTQKALLIKKRGIWKPLAIGALALNILLFILLLMVAHRAASVVGATTPKPPFGSPSSSQQKAPALKEGVPMDADQVLKPPS